MQTLEQEIENAASAVHSHADFMQQINQINWRRQTIRTELVRATDEQEILRLVDELERIMVQWHRLFIETTQEMTTLQSQTP